MSNKSDYEKLRSVWYAKIKKQGFEDIEKENGSLKRWHSHDFPRKRTQESDHGGWEIKSEYYYLATRLLNEHKFEDRYDNLVWQFYADGLTIREIVVALKKKRIKSNRQTVWLTVKRLEAIMKHLYLIKPGK